MCAFCGRFLVFRSKGKSSLSRSPFLSSSVVSEIDFVRRQFVQIPFPSLTLFLSPSDLRIKSKLDRGARGKKWVIPPFPPSTLIQKEADAGRKCGPHRKALDKRLLTHLVSRRDLLLLLLLPVFEPVDSPDGSPAHLTPDGGGGSHVRPLTTGGDANCQRNCRKGWINKESKDGERTNDKVLSCPTVVLLLMKMRLPHFPPSSWSFRCGESNLERQQQLILPRQSQRLGWSACLSPISPPLLFSLPRFIPHTNFPDGFFFQRRDWEE